jgi:hypothetical protein
MKKQAFNPYLPGWEYIPDGEPYVFDGRLYIYGSHDAYNGPAYCYNDYICWSAPVDDLADWRYEGVIYKKTDDPMNADSKHCLYAPDVCRGLDGRYYLYYALDRVGQMAVAVCDTPAGKYEYLGHVKRADGTVIGAAGEFYQFDPGIFIDTDGRIFLYTGFAPRPDTFIHAGSTGGRPWEAFGSFYIELESDMLTAKHDPRPLIPTPGKSEGTGFEGHEYFEAPSMRKINGKYYFTYSSINSHELCYAVSDSPTEGFEYGGILVSIGDLGLTSPAINYMGNTHGGMVEVNGQWYIFYHRQTNLHQYSRQACAEKIYIRPDGSIAQAEVTSCGLNDGPLAVPGKYEARIACHLIGKNGTVFYDFHGRTPATGHPYFMQNGRDKDAGEEGEYPQQFIANISDGTIVGFKYFQFPDEDYSKNMHIKLVTRGTTDGEFHVRTSPGGKALCWVYTRSSTEWKEHEDVFTPPVGKQPLYLVYEGKGACDLLSVEIMTR